jgi:hypothetical protein
MPLHISEILRKIPKQNLRICGQYYPVALIPDNDHRIFFPGVDYPAVYRLFAITAGKGYIFMVNHNIAHPERIEVQHVLNRAHEHDYQHRVPHLSLK